MPRPPEAWRTRPFVEAQRMIAKQAVSMGKTPQQDLSELQATLLHELLEALTATNNYLEVASRLFEREAWPGQESVAEALKRGLNQCERASALIACIASSRARAGLGSGMIPNFANNQTRSLQGQVHVRKRCGAFEGIASTRVAGAGRLNTPFLRTIVSNLLRQYSPMRKHC